MLKNKNRQEVDDFFTRGVRDVIDPDGAFKRKLESVLDGQNKREIIVKWGVDPTSPDIHIGHAVVLRKLRQLQEFGCKIVFLVGDFTSLIGDPTGKNVTRPEIEQKVVEENMNTYLKQIEKILRTEKEVFSWIRNSDWFTSPTDLNLPETYKVNLEVNQNNQKINVPIAPNSFVGKAIVFEKTRMQLSENTKNKVAVVTLKNFLWFLKKLTHARLIERDMFQERIRSGRELYMHELAYPILQGIDSHIISEIYGSCDLEVGGSDQTFNMLCGREIMKNNGQEPQAVITFELLEGTDGKEKMSKSLNNYIGINEPAEEIFGKTMSIPDTLIIKYFNLCTYTPRQEIEEIEEKINSGKINPRDAKMRLAKEIVSIYHGSSSAEESEKNFLKVFQKKEAPDNPEELGAETDEFLSEILTKNKFVKSKSDFQRLARAGAIENVETGEKITDRFFKIKEKTYLKIGKKKFVRINPR